MLAETWEKIPSNMYVHHQSCMHQENLQPWLSKMCPVKILIRLYKCAGRSESLLDDHVQRYIFWHCDTCIFNCSDISQNCGRYYSRLTKELIKGHWYISRGSNSVEHCFCHFSERVNFKERICFPQDPFLYRKWQAGKQTGSRRSCLPCQWWQKIYYRYPVPSISKKNNNKKTSLNIALVKALFPIQKYWYFSYFSTKTYIMGTH